MVKIIVILLMGLPFQIHAFSYYCLTYKKVSSEYNYSKEELDKYQFATILEQTSSNDAYLSRCSFSNIEQKITCDRYKVDKIEMDYNVNIKKYYVFNSQFNFQLFSDLHGVEDNGRGGISFQLCK